MLLKSPPGWPAIGLFLLKSGGINGGGGWLKNAAGSGGGCSGFELEFSSSISMSISSPLTKFTTLDDGGGGGSAPNPAAPIGSGGGLADNPAAPAAIIKFGGGTFMPRPAISGRPIMGRRAPSGNPASPAIPAAAAAIIVEAGGGGWLVSNG